VSWQVTGIRQDAWADANRIPVEVDKPADDQGRYLHPDLYGPNAKPIGALIFPEPRPGPEPIASTKIPAARSFVSANGSPGPR
jgi:hypothetical protein